MKKKNKLKKRAVNHMVEKFSFDSHCGGGCALLEGAVCAECAEWGGLEASISERLRDIQVIG